jgi:hypothetical protein
LVAAGALHDLIEKAGVSAADLRERFGSRITGLVLAASDDEQIAGYAKRKAALRRQVSRAGDGALTLFAADKLSRLRELRRETAVDGETNATPGPVRSVRCVLAASGTIAARWRCWRNANPNRRSFDNSATSSPNSYASAQCSPGLAEQRPTYPTRALAHCARESCFQSGTRISS